MLVNSGRTIFYPTATSGRFLLILLILMFTDILSCLLRSSELRLGCKGFFFFFSFGNDRKGITDGAGLGFGIYPVF